MYNVKEYFNKDWKRGDAIKYICTEIPDFNLHEYKGEWYERLVPDTLDISEMAARAINCMTSVTDPLADHEAYFGVVFKNNPVYMKHEYSDLCQMKFHEAVPLCRIISGSQQNVEVEKIWMETLLKQIGPEGLLYLPVVGRPWAVRDFWEAGESFAEKLANSEQLLCPVVGRNIAAFTLYYLLTGDELWKNTIDNMVEGLTRSAIHKKDYAYYSPTVMLAVKGSECSMADEKPIMEAEVREIIPALVRWYRYTGSKPAIELARKLINYVIEVVKYLDDNGNFTYEGHFHQHTAVALCVLDYIIATGDRKYFNLVIKTYESGKNLGNTRMGYFPEFVNSDIYENSELCGVADMINLAIKLTEYGASDFYDDADRWIRNMFAEGQLTKEKATYIEKYSVKFGNQRNIFGKTDPEEYIEYDNVLAKNVGAFAGWPRPNEWWAEDHPYGIMHCCTGNSSRALYYIWQGMITRKDDTYYVNLLFNRSTKMFDMDSHIPYSGRVDFIAKEDVTLKVRLPEWVKADEALATVNKKPVHLDIEGRYVSAGEIKAGDILTISFPIYEKWEELVIEKHSYNVLIRGNEIVYINPPGTICPIFNREHYRSRETRWKRKTCFVSHEKDIWW